MFYNKIVTFLSLIGASDEQKAIRKGASAVQKLHENDHYTNMLDIYIGFAQQTGEWDKLDKQFKNNLINQIYNHNNSDFIYASLDYISNYLQAQNKVFYPHLKVLSTTQKAKVHKNDAIISGIFSLKMKIQEFKSQYTIKSIVKFVDNVLFNAWNNGNIDSASIASMYLLKIDLNKLLPNINNTYSSTVEHNQNNANYNSNSCR